jgi:biotin carboxylase
VQAFSLDGTFHALSGPSPAAELAGRAAGALGIGDGPTCTRIRITAAGPQVIELAARVGSPAEAEVVLESTGVDLNALTLRAVLGEKISRDELAAQRLAA